MPTKPLQQMGKFHNKHKPLCAKSPCQYFFFLGGWGEVGGEVDGLKFKTD